MGAQFGRVKNAQSQEDIVIACLRMGWNDAFKHVTKNVKVEDAGKKEKDWPSQLELSEKKWRQDRAHSEAYDDFICGNILEKKGKIFRTFMDYACAEDTDKKVKIITDNLGDLKKQLKDYKETLGDKQLCFGHFQKMFNMAIKTYACLYLCRDELQLGDSLFYDDIINNIKNADCPIDSIILEKLSGDTRGNYTAQKWSKYGVDKKHPVDDYKNVQSAISKINEGKGKCNLYYDFIAWKRDNKDNED